MTDTLLPFDKHYILGTCEYHASNAQALENYTTARELLVEMLGDLTAEKRSLLKEPFNDQHAVTRLQVIDDETLDIFEQLGEVDPIINALRATMEKQIYVVLSHSFATRFNPITSANDFAQNTNYTDNEWPEPKPQEDLIN